MINMTELAEKAIETAKDMNVLLDYSAESISDLEDLIQMFHETNNCQHLPDNVLQNVAAIYGAYLGETLLRDGLREMGLEWVQDDKNEPAIGIDDNRMYPITKVYKRLVNGPEDNLVSFYDVSMMLGKGELEL